MITQETLQENFEYIDGSLFFKKKQGLIEAGTIHHTGYRAIIFKRKWYLAHRLVWLYHHGFLPPMLDHIDGDKLNNHIDNLRVATPVQNQQNKRISKNNKTGVKGISICPKTKKWKCQITVNKKIIYLGVYDDFGEAVNVINDARIEAHGNFARFE